MTTPSAPGEVWRIETVGGRSIPVVLLDSAPFAARSDLLVTAQIREPHELPDNLRLLAVLITEPVKGVVSIADLGTFRRYRFAEFLGRLDSEVMAAVRSALAARFDLNT